MSAILMALALIGQTGPSQPEKGPLPAEFPPSRELSPAHDLFYEDEDKASPEARTAIQSFGACAANRSAELASQTLHRDFRTRAYRTGLQRLSRANEACLDRGRIRSAGLLFAGALAEQLLKRDQQPVNVRLARSASQPAPKAYSPTDQVAICVVRSLPDEAGKLFATEVGSTQEAAAVEALAPAVFACAGSTLQLESNVAGFRAILATAAFRSAHGAGGMRSAQRD